eukprot:12926419-Prorocentrum_lima.AAC.1
MHTRNAAAEAIGMERATTADAGEAGSRNPGCVTDAAYQEVARWRAKASTSHPRRRDQQGALAPYPCRQVVRIVHGEGGRKLGGSGGITGCGC